MITIEQVQKLRILHDAEKAAYENTFKYDSLTVYAKWVIACNELNDFIESIVEE